MSVVLIIADREGENQIALSRGLTLAAKLGVSAQVAGFCYEPLAGLGLNGKVELAAVRKKLLSKRKKEIEAQIRKFSPAGMQASCSVVWQKTIHHWIDQQCARKQYAAVVKTGHRTESFLYTPTDWHLLRECPAPVLIVAEKKWRAAKPIVAAVDLGSKLRVKQRLNDEVIATAKRFAEALDCSLHLVHAIHIPPVLKELDLVDEFSYTQGIKDDLQPELVKLAKRHGLDPKQFRLKQGPVDKVITSEAGRLKAQLVVMGTVGRKGLKAKLMGNTAENVLSRLRTDVLALKP
jgi:universal stress protein E